VSDTLKGQSSAKDINDAARTLMAGLAPYPADVIEALMYEMHHHLHSVREEEAVARLRDSPLVALLVHATWRQENHGASCATHMALEISNNRGGHLFAADELQSVAEVGSVGRASLCPRSATFKPESQNGYTIDEDELIAILRPLERHWSALGAIDGMTNSTLVVTARRVFYSFCADDVRALIDDGVSPELLVEALRMKPADRRHSVTNTQIFAILDADPVLGRQALLSGRFEIGDAERDLIHAQLARHSTQSSRRLKETMR